MVRKQYFRYLKQLKYIFVVIAMISIIVSCAKSGTLTGGPADETPPKMLADASSPNNVTNWDGKPIEIAFDEWITLKNKKDILISPPLKYTPEYKNKGKTLIVTLNPEEELRENTTYVFDLSGAIVDFTVGNPVEDLKYIFSTGDVIDSLTVSGAVSNALTGEPAAGALVMLYTEPGDSLVMLERPHYISKTKEDGTFTVANVRKDTLSIYALVDANGNLKYDVGEEIAYVDQPYITGADSLSANVALRLFNESNVRVLSTRHANNQHLVSALTAVPKAYAIECQNCTVQFDEIKKDSLSIWFEQPIDSTAVVVFTSQDTRDTLSWRKPKQVIDSLTMIPAESTQPSAMYPNDSIRYVFNNLLDSLSTENVVAQDTAGKALDLDIAMTNRTLYVKGKFVPAEQYELMILPNAVTDIFGQTNDTITSIFVAKSVEDFGKLNISLTANDVAQQYVILLYNRQDIQVDSLHVKSGDMREVDGLIPGTYKAQVIKDDNANGLWDTGSVLARKQPEIIKTIEIEPLRKNWEVELNINWEEIE